ncbi:MAG: hypothetical protein ACI311_07460 [Bacilli bacterium]
MIISSNKFAAPELKVEDGYSVKSNRVLNNLKASLPLLLTFIIIAIAILLVSIL